MWSTTTAWHFNRREWCFLQVIFTKLCTFSFTTQFLHSFSSTELQWKMTNKVPDLKTKSSDHHNEDACTRKFWGRSFSVKLFEWLRSHWISLGSVVIPSCSAVTFLPAWRSSVSLNRADWVTGTPLWKPVAQHACQQGRGYQVGRTAESRQGWEKSAASQTRLCLTPVSWFTLRSMEQRHWGKASKNTTHHIPPKQTSRATQIFQLEPREGGRKRVSVASPPPPPSPGRAVLTLGKRKRTDTRMVCPLSRKHWGLVGKGVNTSDGRVRQQWRLPVIDLSFKCSYRINQLNKHT